MWFRLSRRVTAIVLAATFPVLAAPADVEREIAYLLNYIQESGCTFLRNGVESSAVGARNHVQRKFNAVEDRVRSAEDFIQLAASKSTVSGEPYRAHCGGHDMLTGEWLMQELARYRGRPAR